jgi:hypothetical protein
MPDLVLGGVFLVAWTSPASFQGNVVPHLMLVMLLEFIIVHSSAFLGHVMLGRETRKRKIASLLGLGGFYTLFVGGFSLAFRSWWPLGSFWAQMVNRLLSVIVGQAPSGEEKQFLQRSWGVSVLCYLVFAMATTLLPLPRLGVDGVFREGLPGNGLWVEEPHRVMALGFLYFTAVGISELFGHRWMGGASATSQARRAEERKRAA